MTVTFVYWLTSAILYCRLFSDWGSIPSDANSIIQETYIVISQVVYNVFARNVAFKGYKLNRVTWITDVGESTLPMCRMCPTIG